LKAFLAEEFIPRLKMKGKNALSGCIVTGPIGGGKSFLFDATAGEVGIPVLVLKNIRSQWFGQTDVIFERIRRAVSAIEQVIIVVDEADTQFGGVDANAHETERRLTGKVQQMMSDPKLKGKVTWVLMTARIHLLSPDIRRPGRGGDLIIPVLDPEGEDRLDFIKWVLGGLDHEYAAMPVNQLNPATEMKWVSSLLDETLPPGYSAAAFASLKSHLEMQCSFKGKTTMTKDEIVAVISDVIPPDIGETREYQTLQALINCTRRSLLPEIKTSVEEARKLWDRRIRQLEADGVK
jgi:SpoVK/Ycf46/Vps4 family AAA+-type ATPase